MLILDQGRLVGEESAAGLAAADRGRPARTVVLSWDGDREAVAAALAEVGGRGRR